MRLRYTQRAALDGERLVAYLNKHAPEVVARAGDAIDASLAQVVAHPGSGFQTDIAEVRVVFVSRFHFKIFYRVQDNEIHVLHIRHMSRGPLVKKL